MRSTATFKTPGTRHCFAPDADAGFSTGRLGIAGFEAGDDGNCFTRDTAVESSTPCLATTGALCLGARGCFEADTVAGRVTARLGARGQGFQARGARCSFEADTVAGRLTARLAERSERDETSGIRQVPDEGSTVHSASQSCSADENCSWASRDIALSMASATCTGTVASISFTGFKGSLPSLSICASR